MILIEPTLLFEDAFKYMAKDYYQNGEKRYKKALATDFNYNEYIIKLHNDSINRQSTERAPTTTLWLVDGKNIFAVSRLRHYLVPRTEKEGGHIGYDVPPSFRKKGYATLLLKLTLEKAKEIGLDRVLITCDTDNIASSKVIIKNGGVFEDEIISEESGKNVSRYWVELE